jgi:HD superfamily phosphodiesterase
VLIAAAYLHDIGYAPTLARTGFHPLDGAVHLRELGEERLAGLVAHHSGAETEARLRGLAGQLVQLSASGRRLRTL